VPRMGRPKTCGIWTGPSAKPVSRRWRPS
jgi:hypothetical protein